MLTHLQQRSSIIQQQVIKFIKSIQSIATNVNGSNNHQISIKLFTQDDLGGSNTDIVSTVTVPADGSVVVLSRENPIYLLEDKSIGAFANTGNTITVTCFVGGDFVNAISYTSK
jgi:hypothetical protein